MPSGSSSGGLNKGWAQMGCGCASNWPCTEPFQLSQCADSCRMLRLAFKLSHWLRHYLTTISLPQGRQSLLRNNNRPPICFPLLSPSLNQQASRLLAAGAYDAQSAPRPLRIFPEFQVPLDSPYRPAIEALVNAAILTLQGYLQVWGVGVMLLRRFSGGTVKSQK